MTTLPGFRSDTSPSLPDSANAFAHLHGRREANFVEAVVHDELAVREHGDERQAQMHEQRQRQEAVRDRPAEWRGLARSGSTWTN